MAKIIFNEPKNDVIYINDINEDEHYIIAIDNYNSLLFAVKNLEKNSFKFVNMKLSEILNETIDEYDGFDSYKSLIEYYKSKGYEFEAFYNFNDFIKFLANFYNVK